MLSAGMITAKCPSCGAPIRFAHAAAVTTVCGACRSSVARSGDDLRDIGKVSSFSRDLSPLRIGVTGTFRTRRFEIVGVVRKGRTAVRWNEWFVLFDDGGFGWLGEGNGQWAMYEGVPVATKGVPSPRTLSVGMVLKFKRPMFVSEVGRATVIAADGSLPTPVGTNTAFDYADLGHADGNIVATIDGAGDDAVLYAGVSVTLPELELRGLRPMAGWSDDPSFDFDAADVTEARSLVCPNCGGTMALSAPGDAVSMACHYCGSVLSLADLAGEVVATLVETAMDGQRKYTLPLATRVTLDGVEWGIVGCMARCVRWEGDIFPWSEYMLYNPWHGWRWLTEDHGGRYWSFLRQLPAPAAIDRRRTLAWRGIAWRHFQGGRAEVLHVLGEFTWQVRVGDRARTDDYISPPGLLSFEESEGEIVCSTGRYLPVDELRRGLPADLAKKVPNQRSSAAPAQPNPWDLPVNVGVAWGSMALAFTAAVMLFLLATVSASKQTLSEGVLSITSSEADQWLTSTFVVPDQRRRAIGVNVSSDLSSQTAVMHVALLGLNDGIAHHLDIGGRTGGSAQAAWLRPGEYVGRIEVAKAPGVTSVGKKGTVKIVLDPPDRTFAFLVMLLSFTGPLIWAIGKFGFEKARWSTSDHA